MSQAARNLDHR